MVCAKSAHTTQHEAIPRKKQENKLLYKDIFTLYILVISLPGKFFSLGNQINTFLHPFNRSTLFTPFTAFSFLIRRLREVVSRSMTVKLP